MLAGMGVRRLQAVAGAHAERTAEEAELERDQDGPGAPDAGGAADHGLLLTGALGGAGAGGAVTGPAEGAVGGGRPGGGGKFGEVVGDQGDGLAGGGTLSHGAAPAS
ncbi:hypothetical protein GCM10019016_050420 [Streptomyces prasinosporus]|uniref:Uncharacterized protein n=1 Tax=Streptomyces prasinosporus TaxID=68256 RepID=A0ABP6TRJ8_9ACTN